MADERYVLAGNRPWHRPLFEELSREAPDRWSFAAVREDLSPDRLAAVDPCFVFLVHWSWIVPPAVLQRYECVGFHMGDLPADRGGSPLQNIIASGRRSARLNALRLTAELDGGPIYLSEPMSLEGSAEEIYLRQTRLSGAMIRRILVERPDPVPQTGEATTFRRRTPEHSLLTGEQADLLAVHDHVRMLDAEGYPRAFVVAGRYRIELSHSTLRHDRIEARATILPLPETAEDDDPRGGGAS